MWKTLKALKCLGLPNEVSICKRNSLKNKDNLCHLLLEELLRSALTMDFTKDSTLVLS